MRNLLLTLFLIGLSLAVSIGVTSAQSFQSVYSDAVNSYCKTATPMACNYYRGHAAQCLPQAFTGMSIYQQVQQFEHQGFTSDQAANMAVQNTMQSQTPTAAFPDRPSISVDDITEIAQAAAGAIEEIAISDKLVAEHPGQVPPLPPTFPRTAEAFARDIVLPTCLANVAAE
jgi:hypothetical protein